VVATGSYRNLVVSHQTAIVGNSLVEHDEINHTQMKRVSVFPSVWIDVYQVRKTDYLVSNSALEDLVHVHGLFSAQRDPVLMPSSSMPGVHRREDLIWTLDTACILGFEQGKKNATQIFGVGSMGT
jgi:hypothetical protein